MPPLIVDAAPDALVETRPFKKQHRARLIDPDDFKEIPDWGKKEDGKFRTTWGGTLFGKIKVPATIAMIWGQLKSQKDDEAACQALGFLVEHWTAAEAKDWLKDNEVKYISFEPATDEDSARAGVERRFVSAALAPVSVEKRQDDKPVITGYGAVFYDGTAATEYQLWENTIERIMPTAFDRALREDDVRGLFNHDTNMLLGRTKSKTMRLTTDAKGLRYEIDPPESNAGRDVLEMIRRGDLSGSSFAFIPTDQKWRKEKQAEREITIREILSVQLFDTGPVTFPAYESTTAAVRVVGRCEHAERDYRAWLDRQAADQARVAAAHDQTMAAARLAEIQEQA